MHDKIEYGQLRTYTDDLRMATVQQWLPFTPSDLYLQFRPETIIPCKRKWPQKEPLFLIFIDVY
jgi:hypothetical protein